jgi:hypothetical protein
MNTTTQLNEAVDKLLELRDDRDDLRERLNALNEAYEAQATHILELDWPEATLKYDDVTISKVNVKSVKIIDPKLVITWMKRAKIKLEPYMRLDAVKVKPVLTTALFTEGRAIPGTEHELKTSLRVTDK